MRAISDIRGPLHYDTKREEEILLEERRFKTAELKVSVYETYAELDHSDRDFSPVGFLSCCRFPRFVCTDTMVSEVCISRKISSSCGSKLRGATSNIIEL